MARLSLNNPALFFPFLLFIPETLLTFIKIYFYTTAKLIYFGKNSNALIMLFLHFSQNCLLASIHFWLQKVLVKYKLPIFLLTIIFYGIYIMLFILSIADFDYVRNNMQMILPSTYVQYEARSDRVKEIFSPYWSNVKGQLPPSKGQTKFIIISNFIALLSLFVIFTWKKLVNWAIPPSIIHEGKYDDDDLKNPNKYLVIMIHILGIFYIIFNLILIFTNEDFKARYYSILPHFSATILAMTHFESRPSLKTLSNITNITRNYLPPGRFWIDTRDDPIYPEVHSDFDTFCSYNKGRSKLCEKVEKRTLKKEEQYLTEEELPNIIVLMIESFNPATFLINEDFLREHVNNVNSLKTDTPFYNKSAMPFLYKFAKEEAVTFSGMQSLGLPSHSGLHTLLTHEPPSQTYMNFINGWQNHVDDFPTFFRDKGYRSMILNGNKFNFDGKHFWIYKKGKREEAKYRLKCLSSYGDSFNDTLQRKIGDYSMVSSMRKDCSEKDIDDYLKKHKDIYDFPKFFDYAAAYYPYQYQAKEIGIDPNTIFDHTENGVSGDRIVAKQTEAHWKQQKEILKNKGEKKPIFTLVSSVDGHRPYTGNDMRQFYSVVNKSIKSNTEAMRVALFFRAYNYTDEYYLKEIINWLKINDPNTIVLITGDHGTRDVPAKEPNGKVVDGIKFDPKCIYTSTGSDSFFLVSGLMSYLGNDERIKKAFGLDKLAGKTMKFTVDHGDMIYTTMDIIQKLQGKRIMPTNRKSRNLIDMSLELLNEDDKTFSEKIDKSGWKSISMVSHVVEYHNGMRMVRFHSGDLEGAHIYNNCVYPTGLLKSDFNELKDKRNYVIPREVKDPIEKKKLMNFVNEAIEYLTVENYLGIKNRLYNYAFRDEKCIKNMECKLPEKIPDLVFNDFIFVRYIFIIFVEAELIIITPVLIAALYKVYRIYQRNHESENALLLENTSNL